MTNQTLENLHLGEIKLMRKALDVIQISGSDAQFVANLQIKLDTKIQQVEKTIKK